MRGILVAQLWGSAIMYGFVRLFAYLIQVRDAGNLLTRAGLTLPGVDVDEYTVRYDSGELFFFFFLNF